MLAYDLYVFYVFLSLYLHPLFSALHCFDGRQISKMALKEYCSEVTNPTRYDPNPLTAVVGIVV